MNVKISSSNLEKHITVMGTTSEKGFSVTTRITTSLHRPCVVGENVWVL